MSWMQTVNQPIAQKLSMTVMLWVEIALIDFTVELAQFAIRNCLLELQFSNARYSNGADEPIHFLIYARSLNGAKRELGELLARQTAHSLPHHFAISITLVCFFVLSFFS